MNCYLPLFLLLALAIEPLAALPELNGKALLGKAFDHTQQLEYVAEISKPNLPGRTRSIKAIFYRSPQPNGTLCLRADFLDAKGVCWSFLENGDGLFAFHTATGLVVRGEYFYPLYQLECMNNRPYWREFDYAEFTVKETKFDHHTAYQVIARTKASDLKEKQLDGLDVIGLPGELAKYPRHPFVREYMIDRATCAILSLRTFGASGQLLFRRNLGKVNLHPDWSDYPHIFDTPKQLAGTVFDFGDFQKMVQAQLSLTTRRRHQQKNRAAWEFIVHNGRFLLGVLGLLFLGLAWWWRRKDR